MTQPIPGEPEALTHHAYIHGAKAWGERAVVLQNDYDALRDFYRERCAELERQHIEWMELHGKEISIALQRTFAAQQRAEAAEAENVTLRNAQKACETCDEITMEEVARLRSTEWPKHVTDEMIEAAQDNLAARLSDNDIAAMYDSMRAAHVKGGVKG